MSMALGKKIKAMRRLKRLTQRDLAQHIGISVSQLSCIERGRKSPSADVVLKIARALGVPLNEFFILPEKIKKHAII
ncbi:MAG TPA: helix-turn-helix transcriptional regulator [Firmicutes bacterium]|nr:helix-turn-helix transcriptional regulator [Bacillota bacterium]